MNIELFLNKINQEMIRTGPASPDIVAGCDFYVSWTKECCILDFKMPSKNVGDPAYREHLLRKEDVGGMLWSPKSGAVYKLDEEAYHTLLELDHGLNHELVARKMKTSVREVDAFVSKLSALGLA